MKQKFDKEAIREGAKHFGITEKEFERGLKIGLAFLKHDYVTLKEIYKREGEINGSQSL